MPEIPNLTILIVAADAVGHMMASIGIAEQLRDRGHKIVFAVPDGWRNKFAPQGFIEEWLNPEVKESLPTNENKLESWSAIVSQFAPAFLMTPEEQLDKFYLAMFQEAFRQTKENEPKLKRIMAKVKPDLVIVDLFTEQPSIMDAGVPWILSLSINPSSISRENTPPAFSGYPSGSQHKEIWDHYHKSKEKIFHNVFLEVQEWCVQNGGPKVQYDQVLYMNYSPYANIYMYPEELDYTEFRPNPPNFHRFDTFLRKGVKEDFAIPEILKNKPGKLVYFSMGTIGCSELGMMKRLISILGKSPHRFIVSKGPLADQIELADNMWGEPSVPQTKVLPLVDFVISHGGNNTVTESFYFGKPMIVIPLFGDQPDNAQRLMETGLGIRLHSHHSTEDEILAAIEKMASDDKLVERITNIGKRIQASNCQARVADLIEKIGFNNRKKISSI